YQRVEYTARIFDGATDGDGLSYATLSVFELAQVPLHTGKLNIAPTDTFAIVDAFSQVQATFEPVFGGEQIAGAQRGIAQIAGDKRQIGKIPDPLSQFQEMFQKFTCGGMFSFHNVNSTKVACDMDHL